MVAGNGHQGPLVAVAVQQPEHPASVDQPVRNVSTKMGDLQLVELVGVAVCQRLTEETGVLQVQGLNPE